MYSRCDLSTGIFIKYMDMDGWSRFYSTEMEFYLQTEIFKATLWWTYGNVCTLFIASWKAYDQLPIRDELPGELPGAATPGRGWLPPDEALKLGGTLSVRVKAYLTKALQSALEHVDRCR